MKRLLAVVAVLALSATTATVARERGADRGDQDQSAQQQQDENSNQDTNRGGRQGTPRAGGGFRRAPNANAQPAPQAVQPQVTQQPAPAPQAAQNGRRNLARDNDRDNTGRGDNDRRGDNNGRVDNNDRRGDNDRRFDNNDRRFDNNRGGTVGRNFGYQRDQRAGRDFRFRGRSFVSVRAPRYIYPRGYSYRRWTVGALLPLFFLSDQYYADWDYIGLPPPGPGEEWIRYGSDALLVDRYSGRVIDTAYNVFY